jgi:hypothetical protein
MQLLRSPRLHWVPELRITGLSGGARNTDQAK